MGVLCTFFSITNDSVDRIRKEKVSAWDFDGETGKVIKWVPRPQTLLQKLTFQTPQHQERDWFSLNAEKHEAYEIDVDKAWNVLHFILEQQSPSVDFIQAEGEILPGDNGLGPARYFSPEAVSAYADALDGMTMETFDALYDPNTLSEKNLYGPSDYADEDSQEYYRENFSELRDFVLWCREKNIGFIVAFC